MRIAIGKDCAILVNQSVYNVYVRDDWAVRMLKDSACLPAMVRDQTRESKDKHQRKRAQSSIKQSSFIRLGQFLIKRRMQSVAPTSRSPQAINDRWHMEVTNRKLATLLFW